MCNHHWKVSSPAPGKHEIGTCELCGAQKDFTELQAEDKGLFKFNRNKIIDSKSTKKRRNNRLDYPPQELLLIDYHSP